jgi:transposase
VIHAFNEFGLRALDPQWAGGRPRRISDDDEAFIVATAKARPSTPGRPFTCWSLRKLADYLAVDADRSVVVGRERLRQILRRNEVGWQRTPDLEGIEGPSTTTANAATSRPDHADARCPMQTGRPRDG